MNYKSIIKKQTFIIGITILVMSVILIGTSYAIFQKITRGSSEQVIETGDFTIYFGPNPVTEVAISHTMVPVTDYIAMQMPYTFYNRDGDLVTDYNYTNKYDFKVKNNGSLPATYKLTLNVNSTDASDHIPIKYLKYSFDEGAVHWLKDCATTTLTITNNSGSTPTTETITGAMIIADDLPLAKKNTTGSEVNHSIRIWIDEDTPEIVEDDEHNSINLIGKKIHLDLRISSDVDEEAADAEASGE